MVQSDHKQEFSTPEISRRTCNHPELDPTARRSGREIVIIIASPTNFPFTSAEFVPCPHLIQLQSANPVEEFTSRGPQNSVGRHASESFRSFRTNLCDTDRISTAIPSNSSKPG